MLFLLGSFFLQADLPLIKEQMQRHLHIGSYAEALKLAANIKDETDPEGVYLAIAALAGSGKGRSALDLFETNKRLLQKDLFYTRSLEAISLSYFKTHFHSTQEGVKLASIAALSLEPDARVLDLLLEAFQDPSVKMKVLILRCLSGFPDEKVKKLLLREFKQGMHPQVNALIAGLFASWHDARILEPLYAKMKEDTVSWEEKLQMIAIIQSLNKDYSLEHIKGFSQSALASERALSAYLLACDEIPLDIQILDRLLQDPLVSIKQAALLTILKRKVVDPKLHARIISWKDEPSFELKKGYYYYGLIAGIPGIEESFLDTYKKGTTYERKLLAATVYASGGAYAKLASQILEITEDPHIYGQLGLYLLAEQDPKAGIYWIHKALERLDGKKIFAIQESQGSLFWIDDESNSALSLSSGQRRAMDHHMRLKIFHLLAVKKLPEAKLVLKQLLKSDLFEVSLDAMVHFWENFGLEDKDYLTDLLLDNDPDLRLKAALVLNYLDYDKSVRKSLLEAYPKQPYSMQIQILFSLSKYHEEDVFDFYISQLKSKYPLIQAVSAGCLFTALYK